MHRWGSRFPSIRGKAYFASCSQGPLSKDVMYALREYERSVIRFGNPWDIWMERIYGAVSLFGDLINAKPTEVCPHASATSALIALLSSLPSNNRRKIITTDLDYPTVGVSVLAAQKWGFKVEVLKNTEGEIPLELYEKGIDEETLLLATFHVSALNGFRQDLKAISEICQDKGCYFLVDTYQSLGTVPLDVKHVNADFLISGATKFLLGIPGAAFLYVREGLVEDLEPAAAGWLSQQNPVLFGREKLDYRTDAKRFEHGTWSVASMYAAYAGMGIIKEIGVSRIWEHVQRVRDYFVSEALDYGFEFLSRIDRPLGPTVSLYFGELSHDVEASLRQRGVITAARGDGVRFAHHFFNTKNDVDKALETLWKIKKDTARDYLSK